MDNNLLERIADALERIAAALEEANSRKIFTSFEGRYLEPLKEPEPQNS